MDDDELQNYSLASAKHKVNVGVSVSVRARPLMPREQLDGDETCVEFYPHNRGTLAITEMGLKPKMYTFDRAFNSVDMESPDYASQATLMTEVGEPVLIHGFEGYNTCVFAYGQTGSGKTYTMMGFDEVEPPSERKGLIPRASQFLFEEIGRRQTPNKSYRVDVQYYEIYNENVSCLLDPSSKAQYRVREHPDTGPFVENLATKRTTDTEHLLAVLERGKKFRHTAATKMNEKSSRSHAVLTVILSCSAFDAGTGVVNETCSKMHWVDLAGSERVGLAGTTGVRLQEGAMINKSLLALGNVIEGLASNEERHGVKAKYIGYRDTTLTWLLKEALGGNSMTHMLAFVSPSALHREESLNTLKYADRAKKIQNKATVNTTDRRAQLIHDLLEENKRLKDLLREAESQIIPGGLSVAPGERRDSVSAARSTKDLGNYVIEAAGPFLVQAAPLPQVNDTLVYNLIEGDSTVRVGGDMVSPNNSCNIAMSPGSMESMMADNFVMLRSDLGVRNNHCRFNYSQMEGVRVSKSAGNVFVNGKPVDSRYLEAGDIVRVGDYEFHFHFPGFANQSFLSPMHRGGSFRGQLPTEAGFNTTTRTTLLGRMKEKEEYEYRQAQQRMKVRLQNEDLPVGELPTYTDVVNAQGEDGQRVVCTVEDDDGDEVVVVEWDQEHKKWVTSTAPAAEVAVAEYIELKKTAGAMSEELREILGKHVTGLDTEKSLAARQGTKPNETAIVVNPADNTIQVFEWTKNGKWRRATNVVAELAAHNLVHMKEAEARREKQRRDSLTLQKTLSETDRLKQEHRMAVEELEEKMHTLQEAHSKALLKQRREEEKKLRDITAQLKAEKDHVIEEYVAMVTEADARRVEVEDKLVRFRTVMADYDIDKRRKEGTIELLSDNVAKLNAERHDAKEELNKLLDEKMQLQIDIDSAEGRNVALHEDVETKAATIGVLEQRVRSMTESLAMRSSNDTQAQLAQKTEHISELEMKLKGVENNLQTLSKTYSALKVQEVLWKKERVELEESLESETLERESLAGELEETKQVLEETSLRAEKYGMEKSKLEEDYNNLRRELDTIADRTRQEVQEQAMVEARQKLEATQRSKLMKEKTPLQTLKEEKTRLQDQVAMLQARREEEKSRADATEKELEKTKKQLKHANDEKVAALVKTRAVSEELERRNRDYEVTRTESDKKEADDAARKELEQQVKREKMGLVAATKAAKESRAKAEDYQKKYEETKEELDRVKKELGNVRAVRRDSVVRNAISAFRGGVAHGSHGSSDALDETASGSPFVAFDETTGSGSGQRERTVTVRDSAGVSSGGAPGGLPRRASTANVRRKSITLNLDNNETPGYMTSTQTQNQRVESTLGDSTSGAPSSTSSQPAAATRERRRSIGPGAK